MKNSKKLVTIFVVLVLLFTMNSVVFAEQAQGTVSESEKKLEGQFEGEVLTDSGVKYVYNFDFYLNGEVVITRTSNNQGKEETIDDIFNYTVLSSDELFDGALQISIKVNENGEYTSGKIKEFENLIIDKIDDKKYALMFDANAPEETLIEKRMEIVRVSNKHLAEDKQDKQDLQKYLNSIWFPISICGVVFVIGVIIILVLRNRAKKK